MVNRGEEKVRVHMNVVLRSTMYTKGSIPTEVKRIFSLPRVVSGFPLLGLTPSGSFMDFA